MKQFEKDIISLDLSFESDLQLLPLREYTSAIISFSTGIDSTGALYWALMNLDKRCTKLFLLYCDTGMEYDINKKLFYQVAEKFDLIPVFLRNKESFMDILRKREMWPDMKNRWCTAYLKTGITNHWIRMNRDKLGEKCLFITGERRDESPRRSKMPEVDIHSTTLKTERKGKFICHWLRPCLDYSKQIMFEMSKEISLDPHPCYEYCGRCSCMFCVFMSDEHAKANMMRHPEKALEWVEAERSINHRWKQKTPLSYLWNEISGEVWDNQCEDAAKEIIV